MFNSNGGRDGYGSTTDDSESRSPLRGPRYLPVYDSPFLGATSNLEGDPGQSTDEYESNVDNEHDHHPENGNSLNNIPIHYKAMAVAPKQVSWKIPDNLAKEDDALNGSTASDPYLSEYQPKRRILLNLPVIGFILVIVFLASNALLHGKGDSHKLFFTSDLPFLAVSRTSFNQNGSPEEIFDMNLFPVEMKKHLLPFPTGAFWTNLVLKTETTGRKEGTGAANGDESLSNPVAVYPYAFKWSTSSLAMTYPSYRRIVQPLVIQDVFWPDISITAAEGIVSRKIVNYDHLSVTVRMESDKITTQSNADSYFETYMVQGSPYITTKFEKSSPILTALSIWDDIGCVSQSAQYGGLCSIQKADKDDDDSPHPAIITGIQFLLTQAEGQHWILFVNGGSPVTFYLSADRRRIVATKPYSGILRLAMVPPGADLQGKTVMQLLNHSAIHPVSGKVLINYDDDTKPGSHTGTVTFAYDTVEGNSNNNIDLLMLALPHHKNALKLSSATVPEFDSNYRCIKGDMTPVVGSQWTAYVETLTETNLKPDTPIVDENAINVIKRNVLSDRGMVIPTATDSYGFGKQIARMAQLAQIAHNIGMDNTDVETILSTVYEYLTKWLDGNGEDAFVFDKDIGGIVTKNGLEDPFADFGNGWYNDHHFHYGYFIYAATILSTFNSTFLDEYSPHISSLVHDISNDNPSSTLRTNEQKKDLNQLFPYARHKSWFDGHSWASGLFQQANGKGQESSSEAVNAYFATYLWQKMMGNTKGMNLARLLLATEIRSAQTYWHSGPSDTLYPLVFANNWMVGNIGGLDATCTTWFGNKISYVHLINFMPLTSITRELFLKDYVEGEYRFLEPFIPGTEASWQGYLVALHGIIDPEGAWKEAQDLKSYLLDPALSKSQLLYWIASDPSLGISWNVSDTGAKKSCSANPGCAALTGDCCPTSNGMYLGCCDQS